MAGAGAPTRRQSAPSTLSRHHQAGAESARGLLFTVLGEFVLPAGGAAWTATFIEVLGRLGVEEKACRQALTRTSGDGWLAAERVGRRTCWRLTPEAEKLLTEGTERIFGFTGSQPDWDGRWLLVTARVPESDRTARHLMRRRLGWAGFGSPSPGLWLCTHTDRRDAAERILAEAGALGDALLFEGEYLTGQDLKTMVRQAWDLAAVEARYEAFLAEFRTATASDPLTRVIELVHAWRRFPWIDPALPDELLPAPWSGKRAVRLFAERHEAWVAGAKAEWARLAERAG